MDRDALNLAAEHLLAHRRQGIVMDDLPAALRPGSLSEAYDVQNLLVARLLAGPEDHTVGYKVACTNAVAQQALRIATPLHGRLVASTCHPSPATLVAGNFTTRVIEAEFGIRMGGDVEPVSGGHNATTVAPYVESVLPAIEVVDHRFVDWGVGALSVAADNAIHGCWVQGADFAGDWRSLDLASHTVTVTVDGSAVATGTGAAVLGNPLNVVAWLADELASFGGQLRAGDLITTGVCTDVFAAEAPSTVVADFGVLGSVTIHWT